MWPPLLSKIRAPNWCFHVTLPSFLVQLILQPNYFPFKPDFKTASGELVEWLQLPCAKPGAEVQNSRGRGRYLAALFHFLPPPPLYQLCFPRHAIPWRGWGMKGKGGFGSEGWLSGSFVGWGTFLPPSKILSDRSTLTQQPSLFYIPNYVLPFICKRAAVHNGMYAVSIRWCVQ